MSHLSSIEKSIIILFLAVVFLFSFNQFKESDSFYHLKVGQVIWENGAVPDSDIFSYTANGAPWVTHEWLSELIFYLSYLIGGYWGVIVLVALISVFAHGLIFMTALRSKANIYISIPVILILSYLTFELWIPRPQVFAFVALAALIFLLEGFRRSQKLAFLVGSILVIWFWANAHASVLLGIVLLLLYALFEFAKFRIDKLGEPMPRNSIKFLGFASLASVGVAMLNPNTYNVFLYRSYVDSAVDQLGVLEWKSIFYFLGSQPQPAIFLALMIIPFGLMIWWYGVREESRNTTILAVSGVAFVLPILSIRHVGFWPLIVAAPFAAMVSLIGDKFITRLNEAPRGRAARYLRNYSKLSTLLRQGFAGFFSPPSPQQVAEYSAEKNKKVLRGLVLTALFVLLVFQFTSLPTTYARRDVLPIGPVDYILENNLKGRIFNLYNEGGYLIWRLWPREFVFIDGRSEVFSNDVIQDLFSIVGRREGWDKILDKYGINIAVLPYRPESLSKDTGPLSFELMMRGFHLVYWDDSAMLLVRENLDTRDFVYENSFKTINPFRDPTTIPEEEVRLAGEEIQSLLTRAPESINVREYARLFLESVESMQEEKLQEN